MCKNIDGDTLKKKILYCWLGKAAGGTLGAPYEGVCEEQNLSYYSPVPTQMLPNDDLDLQVVWAVRLNNMDKPRVDRNYFAKAWQENIGYNWDEYGVTKRNLGLGLMPPLTGSYDNWFVHGMGAAIRSEIWACLAPANPELAASYAYEDACLDHAGEGIHAEMFLAAIESAAFVEQDIERMIETGLSAIPRSSLLARSIIDTCTWWHKSADWRTVRSQILAHYHNDNWTDVCINVPFIILGLLAGRGDFDRSICTAVNCGYDTDCTGATLGALMGILWPESIDAKWLKPLGRNLILSPEITGIKCPRDLDEFTNIIVDLKDKIAGQWPIQEPVRQTADHLRIQAKIGTLDSFLCRTIPKPEDKCWKMPDNSWDIVLNGTIGELDCSSILGSTIMLQYEIDIKQDQSVHVLFNTSVRCAVWIDNDFAFRYESPQAIVPAFHRDSYNCKKIHHFTIGKHIITAAMERPAGSKPLIWIIGLAKPVTNEWLTNAFTRK